MFISQETQLAYFDWLETHLKPIAAHYVNIRDGQAVTAWLEDLEDGCGHIEIPARMSRTGHPVTGFFEL